MKKILLSIVTLLAALTFASCDSEIGDHPFPQPETYTLSVSFTSLAGDIEVLLDGEILTNPNTGKPLTGSNITTPELSPIELLVNKGERKLELRDVKQDRIVWDSTFVGTVGQACAIAKFWNGEEMTDVLTIPAPEQAGNIRFFLTFNFSETKRTDPMDIEVYYDYMGSNPTDDITEMLAKIEGYVPGSGELASVEIRPPHRSIYETLYLRLYKAGTQEPYHTLFLNSNPTYVYHYDVADECWFFEFLNSLPTYEELTGGMNPPPAANLILNVSEQAGGYFLNGDELWGTMIDYSAMGKTGIVTYNISTIQGDAVFVPAE